MATSSLELSDLRLLVKIAEAGGLSAAAKLHGIPKTSATRQLQRLERAVGCRLVHRAAGRSALTAEGHDFLSGAVKGLEAIDGSVDRIQTSQAPLNGLLRIASLYTFGRKVVGPRLPLFMQQHPGITVRLILGSRRVDLLADEADVAIRIGSTGGDSLISRRLYTEAFILCASPAYLARTPLEHVDDLGAHRFLDLRPDPAVRYLILENATESRRIALRTVLQTNEPEMIIQAALQDVGVALLPRSMVGLLIAAGSLVACLPDWRLPAWELNALYAPGRGSVPKVRAFLDFLVDHLPAGDLNLPFEPPAKLD